MIVLTFCLLFYSYLFLHNSGWYQDAKGTKKCQECPINTFNRENKSTALGNCLSCPNDFAPYTTTNNITAISDPTSGCVCAGERLNAPDDSPAKRGYYSVSHQVKTTELEQYTKVTDRTLCLECPIGARCERDGLSISNVSSQPGFWRSTQDSNSFHLCLGDGSDCLAGGW